MGTPLKNDDRFEWLKGLTKAQLQDRVIILDNNLADITTKLSRKREGYEPHIVNYDERMRYINTRIEVLHREVERLRMGCTWYRKALSSVMLATDDLPMAACPD